ncbi:MAG TPA: type I-C CRISPR-associated protein Cas7/Csd2 [Edaphobacter sp.]|uniref:type I-C CRISPR-associated protein Cas7/Csd2 n=1 Tax=Edaphobacter sp. TaxID=1934404 RepID=UPI002C7ADC9F|nr:type I-C CRISPR-associated protein Cas7/Csd2 [Edaphobacter sp.]HUZ95877.1 type I-C CRISPR-associated protein Cas7/Csd2 [Edaphobacter sp.]
MSTIENRYDFVFLFDCQDGNPNGDPDSDNSPRFDPETFQGLVSDVCLKRKIRDYVRYAKTTNDVAESGYGIFVLSGNTLESNQRQPFEKLTGDDKIEAKGKDTKPTDIEKARQWMCKNFFDVRAFGAVMSTTEFNCGQVRGPVQITFARSIDRILPTEHTISRQAFTGEKDIKSGTGTLGRKHTIPYGLYLAHGYINPVFAAKTGFSEDDLTLLWKALANLFELDRSAARGTMAARGLYIFKHESKLGNAQAQRLFESIQVKKRPDIESPRAFTDYTVVPPDPGSLPEGITLIGGLA